MSEAREAPALSVEIGISKTEKPASEPSVSGLAS